MNIHRSDDRSSHYYSQKTAVWIMGLILDVQDGPAARFLNVCTRLTHEINGQIQPVVRVHITEDRELLYLANDFREEWKLERRYEHIGIDIAEAARYLNTSKSRVKAALALELLTEPNPLFDLAPCLSDRGIAPRDLDAFLAKYTKDDLAGLSLSLPLAHQYVMYRLPFDDFDDLPRDQANTLDRAGRTALHRAVVWSNAKNVPHMVAGLLRAGCDRAALDRQGRTAGDLLRKRIKGTSDPYLTLAANLLLDGNEPVIEGYEKDDGLLLLLVKLGYVDDVVRNLAEADPWDVSRCLLYARTPAMVDALVGLGADVRFDNCGCKMPSLGLPAFYAAAHGYLDVAQRLIEHGADPSSFDDDATGEGVPLEYAANLNDVATCIALIERGVDVERVKRNAHVWTNSDNEARDNEAWALIREWEQDVLEKVASDAGVTGGQDVRMRARL